jgi:Ca2+-transporting ATPase
MKYSWLSSNEVVASQAKYWPNALPEKKPPTDLQIVLNQLKSPLVYILLIAGLITLYLGDYEDSVVILVTVLLNTLLWRYQESKAGKALQALKDMLQPTIQVIRNSALFTIPTVDIVPWDVVLCKAGSKIPADGTVLESTKITISEAMLTGESLPIEKKSNDLVYMGTIALSWSAYIRIISTGSHTELGKIALSLQTGETITPLQRQLQAFSKQLTRLVIGIVFVVFIVGMFREQSFIDIFTTAVALAVGAIPEWLLVALTVVLAIGMQRILKRKWLVKNLVSAETLGWVTVICSDKTGTLTHGTMEVVEFIGNENELYTHVARSNDDDNAVSKALRTWTWLLEKQNNPLTGNRVDVLPFSSEQKYTACLWQDKNEFVIHVSGAPEYLMQWCNLSSAEKKKITEQIEEYTEAWFRLIACGQKKVDKTKELKHTDIANGWLTRLGIICLADPIREDVRVSLQQTRDAGIKLVVITGDYPGTAKAIMKKLWVQVDDTLIMTGTQLAELNHEQLVAWLNQKGDIKLFARTKPEQKMRIVQALKDNGEVVAMMGDGVNDAPALKMSDIGIVVGEATEVAKESADLILLDSSFSTIVCAIEEGRGMFDNIRKVILYLLCDAFVQIIAILLAMILWYPLPIIASQILWINLVSDGLPSIALTVDPIRPGIMHNGPRSPKEHLVAKWMKQLILLVSFIGAVCSFVLFIYVLHVTEDIELARSVAFASFGIGSLVYVFSIRTLGDPVWKTKFRDNPWLLLSILGWLLLLVAPYFFSWLGRFLQIVPIGQYRLHAFGVAIVMFLSIELYKTFFWKDMQKG